VTDTVPAWSRVVLYVEDNPSNVRLVERVLARRPDVSLLVATSGGVGLELARRHRPDLVLLDLNLPDLPGAAVLEQLRAEPRTRDIPVVVISADATPQQQERLRAAGAADYLTKPFDINQLLAIVDGLVRPGPAESPVGVSSPGDRGPCSIRLCSTNSERSRRPRASPWVISWLSSSTTPNSAWGNFKRRWQPETRT
jgi:CheY-like chemotaxis protein